MNITFNADNIEEVQQASGKLRTLLDVEGVLLTLSKQGICINTKKSNYPNDLNT